MYHLTLELLHSYGPLWVLTGIAVANLWRKRREARRRLLLLTVAFGALTASSLPVVGYVLMGTLEWRYPPLRRIPYDSDAIVVLSGCIRPADRVRLHDELCEDTLYRCLHAAEVYRSVGGIPIIVSGGKANPASPGPPCAPLMRDFLVQLGIREADIIVEPRSGTTYENAVESGVELRRRRLGKIILVTDAAHMERAVRCFRKQGLEVVPSSCRHRATGIGFSLFALLPSPGAARGCFEAIHEWLGMAWYRLHGWI